MKSNLKLLFITNSLTGGGAERSANVIIDELLLQGVDVHLVPINGGPRDLVHPSCKIYELNRRLGSKFFSLFVTFFRLQLLVWRIKPTHLVLNCDLPELLGSLLFGKFKIIAVEHSSQPWAKRRQLGLLVRKILSIRSTIWIAVSKHLKIWGVKIQPDFVISNPLPRNLIKQKTNYKNVTDLEIMRIVFIGRLSLEKNPETIIHLAHQTGLPVLFIGDGYLKGDLLNLSTELGVVSTFLGQKSNPWDFCGTSDLIVVPSQYEGDGLVVVEAIAQGLPVLLSEIPDLLRFRFPSHNYANSVKAFASRISAYRNDYSGLIVPDSIRDEILLSRHPTHCAEAWKRVLN